MRRPFSRRRCPSFCLALLAACGTLSALPAQETRDPLPIQRILVSPDRIAEELEKVKQGALVAVPYDDLQKRLAAAAVPKKGDGPRLAKAAYSAELQGNALVNGRAQWSIRNGDDAGWMPLPRFGLAVSKPQIDGVDAVLGESAGQAGLWIDRPGSLSVAFDWSLRGTPGIGGLTFEFVLPPAPSVSVELRLPLELAPTAPSGIVLVSGPFDSESPKLRIWRLQASGKSSFEVVLRPTSATAGAGTLLAAVESTQTHQPAALQAEFDWHIDVLHHPVQELVFETDARLQPYDVAVRGPEMREWETREEKRDKGPPVRVIVARFREPFVGTIPACKIKCWAPEAVGLQSSPGMRLRGAVGRGETLKLQLHADLQLDSWEPGRFRLAESAATADGSLLLTLNDPAPDGGSDARPQFLLRSQESVFAVTQNSRWTLGPGGNVLRTEIRYDASRGQLFQLATKLPAGRWKAVAAETDPPELMRSWTVVGSALVAELRKGVNPRTDAKLIATFRSEDDAGIGSSRDIEFPDAEPIGGAVRIGSLAIEVDASLNATLLQSSVPPTSEGESAMGDEGASFRFAFRQEKMTGRLRIAARTLRPFVRMDQETTLGSRRTTTNFRADIEPIGGALAHLDVAIMPGVSERARWHGAELRSAERLIGREIGQAILGIGTSHPLERLASQAALPNRQVWRLHFRTPLAKRTALEWTLEDAQVEHGGGVPLAMPLEAIRVQAKVVVRAPASELEVVDSVGLAVPPQSSGDDGAVVTRWIDPQSWRPRLVVGIKARDGGRGPRPLIDQAKLSVAARPGQPALHYLRFEVQGWTKPSLPIAFDVLDLDVLGLAIEGRWLPQPEIRSGKDGVVLLVPTPVGKQHWRCELAYAPRVALRSHPIAFRAEPTEPRFPAATSGLQRRWRLPPDWLPLRQEAFSSWHRRKPGFDSLREAWSWGTQWVLPSAARSDAGFRALIVGESILRKQTQGDVPFGEAFEKTCTSLSSVPAPVVADREAMRERGIWPGANVPSTAWNGSRPFWETLGLVVRPVGSVLLVTSPDRIARWESSQGDDWTSHVAKGIEEAARHGSDGSGEFQAFDSWLLEPTQDGFVGVLASLNLPESDAGWTEWAPLHGVSEPWVAVGVSRVRLLSWAVGIAIGLSAWRFRRLLSAAGRFRAMWLALCGLTFGSFLLPLSLRDLAFAPIVSLLILLGGWHFVHLTRRRANRLAMPSPPTRVAARSVGCIVAAALGGLAAVAQAPTPFVVLLSSSDPNAAFVPIELLRRLKELETAAVRTPAPVVTAASYDGTRRGDAFECEARFDVHAFAEKTEWLLPLTGVDLKPGVFLDGAPIFPTPAAKGYLVPLPSKGTHRLALSFVAKTASSGGTQELRFGVPAAWSARVDFKGTDLGNDASLVRCVGEEVVFKDGKGRTARVKAELGPESFVHLRWQESQAAPVLKTTIRERYLWDLRPAHLGLAGVLLVEPGLPGISKFEIQLPPNLETRTLEAYSANKASTPLLKAWRAVPKGNARWLTVEFNQLVSAPFRIVASWTPRFATAQGAVDLRLPFPAQAGMAESLLAYRVQGVETSDKARNLGVAPLSADVFSKLWADAGQKDSGPITRAYSFGREAGQATLGGLEVSMTPVLPAVQAEIEWKVCPSHADFVAQATWTGTEDLSLVQATLPADVVLMDVQGSQVHHWIRQGDQLKVLLTQPRKQTSLKLVGWRRHPGGADVRFAVPSIRFAGRNPAVQLKLTPSRGMALAVERSGGLKLGPEGDSQVGKAETGAYDVVLRLQRQPQTLDFRMLTVAESHRQRGFLVQHVVGALSHSDPPAFDVTVRHWPGIPRLDLGAPGTVVADRSVPGEHRWTVRFAPGTGLRLAFWISGAFDAAPGAAIVMPETRINTGTLRSELVAARGMDADPASSNAWPETKRSAADSGVWQAFVPDAGRKEWKVWKRADLGSLTLRPAAESRVKAAETIASDRRRGMTEDGRWICEEELLLAAKEMKRIELTLPSGARFLEAKLDGRIVAPAEVGGDRIVVEAGASDGVRLGIRWTLEPTAAAGDRIGSEGVKVIGAGRYPVREAIALPPRWTVHAAGDDLIETWLLEARTMLERSRRLLESPGDPLAERADLVAAQERFRSLLAWAKLRLSVEGTAAPAELLDEWKHLGDENAELVRRFALNLSMAESLRTSTPRSGWPAGMPVRRHGVSDAEQPGWRLDLEPDLARPPLWAMQALVAFFGAVFPLSFVPRGIYLWAMLWPEQMALACAIGIGGWGLTLVGGFLLLIALALRTTLTLGAVRKFVAARWNKPRPGSAAA